MYTSRVEFRNELWSQFRMPGVITIESVRQTILAVIDCACSLRNVIAILFGDLVLPEPDRDLLSIAAIRR